MDDGHGCLLLDSVGSRTDCGVVGPRSIASLALGSDAAWANESAVRCEDGISRFLSWRSPCNRFVAGPDRHSINSTFVC